MNNPVTTYIALICLVACSCATATAQKLMMMGKVMDEQHHPIEGAKINLAGNYRTVTGKSDNLGLFTTGTMPPGDYSVHITIDGKHFSAGHHDLREDNDHTYYYFTITAAGKVETALSNRNPYMEAELENISKNGDRILNKDIIIMKVDSNGDLKPTNVKPTPTTPMNK